MRRLLDFFDKIKIINDLDTLLNELESETGRCGFEGFVLAEIPKPGQAFKNSVLGSRWDPAFLELYAANDYFLVSPMLHRCRTYADPFEWNGDQYARDADPRVRDLIRDASDYRMNRGFLVPVIGPHGYRAYAAMAGASLDLTARRKRMLQLMVLVAFQRLWLLRPGNVHAPGRLTEREREVLSWVAQGKSAWEIGKILNIAKRTVDEHVHVAMTKLGAVNRTHAATLALRDGLIDV